MGKMRNFAAKYHRQQLNMVLLSFDTEEFDVPREHGVKYDTLTEGMAVSAYGTNKILDVLKA